MTIGTAAIPMPRVAGSVDAATILRLARLILSTYVAAVVSVAAITDNMLAEIGQAAA
jgi:hypothetical protein